MPRWGGSSPLTRGKPELPEDIAGVVGLIPAHAGKTMRRARIRSSMRAHPRSRGENVEIILDALGDNGSSPLTRGKLREGSTPANSRGLIPAHAGKTHVLRPPTSGERAHPRSRGENVTADFGRPGYQGSSPLTRGKRDATHHHVKRCELIPAHAGKTT